MVAQAAQSAVARAMLAAQWPTRAPTLQHSRNRNRNRNLTTVLACAPPLQCRVCLHCGAVWWCEQAYSGNKAEDKSQGPLQGLLKDAGYTESMVYKF
jgi:hypothetical protein